MKKYVCIWLCFSYASFGQNSQLNKKLTFPETLKSDSIGLQQLNTNWVLEKTTFSDSNSYLIIDTTQFDEAVYVIEYWRFVKTSKLEVKKIIEYNPDQRQVVHEQDVYIKSMGNDLLQKITLAYNYPTNEFKATIDTTLSDFKLAQNHRILRERIENGDKLCGFATTNILYDGYKYTMPKLITEAEARKYIEKMGFEILK